MRSPLDLHLQSRREVNGVVGQMDRVTQQNAAMVEETTAASHALSDEADALSKLISRFSLGQETHAHASAKAAT